MSAQTRFMTLKKWRPLKEGECPPRQVGLWALLLDCWERKGPGFTHIGRLVVNSGGPDRQHFRTKANQHIGEREPVPEGIYPLAPLYFASGKWGDYSEIFPSIESPISQTIEPQRAIEFHLDGNRKYAPGSAGCVVFRNMDDVETFVSWFDGDPKKMTNLFVNWGLGRINWPSGLKMIDDPEG